MNHKAVVQALAAFCAACLSSNAETNPIIKDAFTVHPAATVYNDAVYLYTGHDEARGRGAPASDHATCGVKSGFLHWSRVNPRR